MSARRHFKYYLKFVFVRVACVERSHAQGVRYNDWAGALQLTT